MANEPTPLVIFGAGRHKHNHFSQNVCEIVKLPNGMLTTGQAEGLYNGNKKVGNLI
jgi:hypothetical protein